MKIPHAAVLGPHAGQVERIMRRRHAVDQTLPRAIPARLSNINRSPVIRSISTVSKTRNLAGSTATCCARIHRRKSRWLPNRSVQRKTGRGEPAEELRPAWGLLSCYRTRGGSHATCGTGPAPKRSGRFKSPADWPCDVPELPGRNAPHLGAAVGR